MQRRLGIYVDTVYTRTAGNGAARYGADPVDAAFLHFLCEVGRAFSRLVFFGRAGPPASGTRAVGPTLPAHVEVVELPSYRDLREVRRVASAGLGTLVRFWRGLERVDVVWAFGPHPFSLLLVVLGALRGKRVVLGVRQDTVSYFRLRLPSRSWLPVLAGVWLLDGAYRALGRRLPVTVVGEAAARRYGRREGVFPMIAATVPASLVVERPAPRDWSGTIELLTVGRLEPEKNPLLLLEALAGLEAERPGRYRLTWAGSGQLEEEIRRRAQELGLEGRLDLRGYVPFGPAVFDLYRRAHLFVHVSRTEGVPQVLLEALAFGIPVLATDVGGVRSALGDGGAGLLVPPADGDSVVAAVRRLTDDAVLREELVMRGLEIARASTLETEAARVARFIAGAAS